MGKPELVEVSGVATHLGISTSTVRLWESKHWIPRAMRLESGRRVWRTTDLPEMKAQIEERRARCASQAAGAA